MESKYSLPPQGLYLSNMEGTLTSQTDTTKDRLTPALLGISHNDTRKIKTSPRWFCIERTHTAELSAILPRRMWDYRRDAREALWNQQLPETSYTVRPSPPGFVGSLSMWLHHRHLAALESRTEWSFLVVAFATTSPQTIETRATKVVGCQNCCQRFCQHSNAIQEYDILADMATPIKHHTINCVKKN